MRIAVIGVLGFIGSHLADALKAQGHYVWGIDNESQSAQAAKDSAADAVTLGDARDLLRYHPKGTRFDYVFHCASPAGPARIAPGYALLPIIETTHTGLEFALQTGARFVKFSSSECYNRTDAALEETTPALVSPAYDARSEYQLGFLAAEQLCFTHPWPEVQVLRLFNVTGPRQDPRAGVVLPRFCKAALDARPLQVLGNGSQRRAFMDVSDMTAFCLCLMDRWPHSKGLWNVAKPSNTTTIMNLANLVIRLAHSTSRVEFVPDAALGRYYRDGAGKCGISINKALQIGWTPKIELDALVARTLAWHQEQMGALRC